MVEWVEGHGKCDMCPHRWPVVWIALRVMRDVGEFGDLSHGSIDLDQQDDVAGGDDSFASWSWTYSEIKCRDCRLRVRAHL